MYRENSIQLEAFNLSAAKQPQSWELLWFLKISCPFITWTLSI